jgi:anti-sigma B factor antagonist
MRPKLITTQIGGSLWLLRLEGEHDISTVSDLHRELDRIFETGTSVVVDLAAATFVDSSILSELIRGGLRPSTTEKMAVVAPPGSAAAGLFELVDAANKCFPVFDSVGAAVEFCRGPAALPA